MKFKAIAIMIGIAFILSNCQTNNQKSKKENVDKKINKKIKKELDSGERYKYIFLDFRFGMTKSQYRNHFENLKRKGKIYLNNKNEYEYKFDFGPKSMPRKGFANFHGEFFDDKLYKLIMTVESREFAPNLKLLQLKLVRTYGSKYGYGDAFSKKSPISDTDQYIWINGNRKIEILCAIDKVKIIYTNLVANRKKERKDNIQTVEKERDILDDI